MHGVTKLVLDFCKTGRENDVRYQITNNVKAAPIWEVTDKKSPNGRLDLEQIIHLGDVIRERIVSIFRQHEFYDTNVKCEYVIWYQTYTILKLLSCFAVKSRLCTDLMAQINGSFL